MNPLKAIVLITAVASMPGLGGMTHGSGPDIIVGDLPVVFKWGTLNDITSYSVATTACNIGDEEMPFQMFTSSHPVIAQDLYRLKDGRLEQIGMSWVKHAFGSATQSLCQPCNNPGSSQIIGVGCSDPYAASTNGDQDGFSNGTFGGLGPRSDVNPLTGVFPFPYSTQGVSGDVIFKRLQVHNTDIDPALNLGSMFFIESQYHAPEDAAAKNQNNNASYRRVLVSSFTDGGWNLVVTSETQREKAAIHAWQDFDPAVQIVNVNVPLEGRFIVAWKVSQNPDKTWHYEYAIYNLTSHRSAASFSVPKSSAASVMNIDFHDVDYHSGELYEGTDWAGVIGQSAVTWNTQTFDVNPNANALRWGTLYNFSFDSDAPPVAASATIGLFRPDLIGTVNEVTVQLQAPVSLCSGDCATPQDGTVDVTDLLALLAQWGGVGSCDADGSGTTDVTDLLTILAAWGVCP